MTADCWRAAGSAEPVVRVAPEARSTRAGPKTRAEPKTRVGRLAAGGRVPAAPRAAKAGWGRREGVARRAPAASVRPCASLLRWPATHNASTWKRAPNTAAPAATPVRPWPASPEPVVARTRPIAVPRTPTARSICASAEAHSVLPAKPAKVHQASARVRAGRRARAQEHAARAAARI